MPPASPEPRGLLLAQTPADATTAIVIGGLGRTRDLEFSRFQRLLWFVDAAHRQPAPAALPVSQLEIAAVETLAPEQITAVVERFLRLNPRRLPALFVTDAILATHSAAYPALIERVHAEIEDTRRARITRQQDGFTWQKHRLRNARAYAQHRLPAAWAGALRGIPAFVCGAGPSLDISIAPLAAHAQSAVIFSADSALRALARHGVQADFAVSTDVAKLPEKCLPDQLPPRRVVLSSISPPAWQDALPQPPLFISGHQLTDDWFAAQGVPRTALAASESCGSTAIDLALHLGCEPIYLFGLDLAVDPANQARRHQQDANPELYLNSNYDPGAQLPRVPGNYAEKVPCFALGDWRALDARLAARTTGKIYNVTDRGARLRGTTVVHPDHFTLSTPAFAKAPALAALPDIASASNSGGSARERRDDSPFATASTDAALARLRTAGERCVAAIPALRAALAQGGPVSLAAALREFAIDPDCGRGVLGAFALKLMPHLVPPIEGDTAFWTALLDEYSELAQLAATA